MNLSRVTCLILWRANENSKVSIPQIKWKEDTGRKETDSKLENLGGLWVPGYLEWNES